MGIDAQAVGMSTHIEKYASAIDQAENFQTWFNRASNDAEAAANGFWDFAIHIATPEVRHYLGSTYDRRALEIGCGGGRMLAAASRFFRSVVGIDIHRRMQDVETFLSLSGISNASVLTGDGETIPLKAESVDFVYSFIVFHHLQSFAAFKSYVRESFRVLEHGGVANLYYGESDRLIERQEYEANSISLAMPKEMAAQVATDAGFEVLAQGKSWRFGEPELRRGYQGSLVLLKR